MTGFAPLTSRGSQQYRALTVPELTCRLSVHRDVTFGPHDVIRFKGCSGVFITPVTSELQTKKSHYKPVQMMV